MTYYLASDGAADIPTVYEVENGLIRRCWPHTPAATDYAAVQALIDEDSADVMLISRAMSNEMTWPAPDLAALRLIRVREVDALRDAMLAAGAPYGGRRIAVTDTGRTDLGGMATTAVAAIAGALPWPEDYALGWIALDNTRIALPGPSDGLALADAAGRYYAGVVQAARTIKDAILGAQNSAELVGLDITTGWPSALPS